MSTAGSALGLLDWAVNRALAADAEAREHLQEIDGARIRFVAEPVPGALDFTVRGQRVVVSRPGGTEGEEEEAADLTITGPVPALLRLLALRDATDETIPEGVSLRGDHSIARHLRRLARSYRFDWEEVLAGFLGDALAHEAARGARTGARATRRAAGALSRDFAEYLTEESAMVAGAPALARFLAEVDEVRDDVERLEARVAALSRRLEEQEP